MSPAIIFIPRKDKIALGPVDFYQNGKQGVIKGGDGFHFKSVSTESLINSKTIFGNCVYWQGQNYSNKNKGKIFFKP